MDQMSAVNGHGSARAPGPEALRNAAAVFKGGYDARDGGFGSAPKFPQPSVPRLLLRCARRFGDGEAVRMVLHTCDRMAAGGIHDQLGGGFSRYSVDGQWLAPHFEKMLYDNAQLAELYLDAWLISGEWRQAEVCRDILDYVLRDLTHPEGGFYSAEDADSEGHEGKFYCWTRAELARLLAPEEFNVAVRYFGITEEGNFIDHSHPHPLRNQNVLSVAEPDLSGADRVLLASAKRKLLEARAGRVRPHLDDKVLASWNGLMLGAMARASAVLKDGTYRGAAEQAARFLREKLWEAATETLHHRWRDGERDEVQLLEGYAFMLSGMLELYEATIEPAHLEFSIALAESMLARFYDAERGGFWLSAAGSGDLILRLKEDYDGAVPGGNSVATLALLKLGKITGRREFTEAAEKTLRLFAHRLEESPQAVAYLLQALDFSLDEPVRVVVAGEPGWAGTQALVEAAHGVYQPNKVVLGNTGPVEEFARGMASAGDGVVYVCSGTSCQAPTRDAKKVMELVAGTRIR
jgi:hypothetical protein